VDQTIREWDMFVGGSEHIYVGMVARPAESQLRDAVEGSSAGQPAK
jgi:hypothetical protein